MTHTNPTPRRTWPWVVLVVVVVAAIVVGASVISSLAMGSTSAKPATSAPSVTPVETASATPISTPTPTSRSTGAKVVDVARIEGAIEDSGASELYNDLTEPVHVQFAASDFDSDRSRDNAVNDLDYIDGSSGWNWKLDAATLAQFRAGAYGDSFPAGAIVGESAEGYVISFTITKAKVSAIFVSKSVDLVTAPKP